MNEPVRIWSRQRCRSCGARLCAVLDNPIRFECLHCIVRAGVADAVDAREAPSPDGDGASGSALPQLDSNQQPFDYTDAQLRAAA